MREHLFAPSLLVSHTLIASQASEVFAHLLNLVLAYYYS